LVFYSSVITIMHGPIIIRLITSLVVVILSCMLDLKQDRPQTIALKSDKNPTKIL